jgi:hypothetical protein
MDDQTLVLFLSTVATATAALVAIVGGLLVSRVVSLASERSGLLHRRDDLVGQLDAQRQRSGNLEHRLLRWDAIDVLWDHYTDLAAEEPKVDLARWIADEDVDRTPEEIAPFLDEIRAELLEARRALEPLFADGHIEHTLDDFVEGGVVQIPPGKQHYYDRAFRRLTQEHPHVAPSDVIDGLLGHSYVSSIPAVDLANMRTANEDVRHDQLQRDADEAHHRVTSLEVQVEQVELALARVSAPVGVGAGLAVLAYFAFVGAVVPLWLLLYVDRLLAWVPSLVLGLFVSGFVALLGNVGWQVAHLTDSQATAVE